MMAHDRLAQLRAELVSRAVQIVTAGLLLGALARWPIGYYEFLRLVICVSAGFLAWRATTVPDRTPWVFVMGALILLFNPIYPIHFRRDIWAWLDGLAALAFLACPSNREVRHDQN